MMVDSLIFDLDGTLWDSRKTVADSWNIVIRKDAEVKKELTVADLKATMGLRMHEIMERLFPYLSKEKRESLLEELSKEELGHIRNYGGTLYPKVEETLSELAKTYQLFIVSNCQEGYIEAFYEAHGLEKYFQDFENPGRTGLSKGENIQLIIKRNNLQSPIYIGDTDGDREAAKYAGIPFVYASYGFGEVIDKDHIIEQFQDLLHMRLERG
ncbi:MULTISPECIES: HAD family hydrolase [Cytobacillus]|uniref:HAD family hydrolase n=1 Tax=Cytobacillus TaxID=2675230 RepID=UPI001CD4A23F|nr:HAD family hydrolase [Cytobacillus kochii]MCA1024826.1 HAD family hydrolase [Cytobacillus kochii]MCM3323691.1 HAD family hydrolase [Cytobacillus kochii]MCM3346128.1 HAD family hydrolase [Cytobacillus kochii]MDQ0188060.1 phosphoglycolate phosphatase [Cytobacillus kochii]